MADLQQNKPLIFENAIGFRWWFVFGGSDHPVLRTFLKKDFSHVYAFCQLENVCLVIEPMMGCVNNIIIQAEARELIEAAKDDGRTVVCKVVHPQPEKFVGRAPIITCASYLAYTVGISGMNLTPYQLYKKLIACGGDEI